MKANVIFGLVVLFVVLNLPIISPAQTWLYHKMHFPQLPDAIGWDVNATFPIILADDWQCSETGPVTDIHFWGSWLNGNVGTIAHFTLSIHNNIPGPPFSRPGTLLWEREIFDFDVVPIDPPTWQGWYDPELDITYWNDHNAYFQYNIVNVPDPFVQQVGTIYWLNISAYVLESDRFWGWKTSRDHWMDDAVWAICPVYDWQPMIEPPRYNEFKVSFDEDGVPTDEGSTNYYSRNGTIWWHYEESNWWNIWFYDNPFTYDHQKDIFVMFDVMPTGTGTPSVEFALNWSTDIWSLEGEPGRPPLPGDGNEDLYIGRQEFPVGPNGHFEFTHSLSSYNPEWVSIDFRAQNVIIYNAYIEHECVGTSMDMAFVITTPKFIRGDAEADGDHDIFDALLITFGPSPPPCMDAADADDNGAVGLLDADRISLWLGGGAQPPPAPCCNIPGSCDQDPTPEVPDLGCLSYPPCGNPKGVVARGGWAEESRVAISQEDSLIIICDNPYPEDTTIHLPVYARVSAHADTGLIGIQLMFYNDYPGLYIDSIVWNGPSIGEESTAIDLHIETPLQWTMYNQSADSCRGGTSLFDSMITTKIIPPGYHLLCWLVVETGAEGNYLIEPRGGIGNPPLENLFACGLTEVHPSLDGCIVNVTSVGVGESSPEVSPPKVFSLSQNYPNPFNPITEITYALPKACLVKLTIYNLLGQEVAALVDEKQTAGYKAIHWDSRSQAGNEVSSGLYFYRLQAGDFVETRKMILLR